MKDTLYPLFLRALRNGAKNEDIAKEVTEALNSAIKTINAENANLTRAAGLLNEYLGENANITLEDLKAFCAGRTPASPNATPNATPNASPNASRKTVTILPSEDSDDATIWKFLMSL